MEKVDGEIFEVLPGIHIPTRATAGSAGYDLYAPCDFWVPPLGARSNIIDLGIKCHLPEGYYLRITSRSSMAMLQDLSAVESVIDNDYKGTIKICLFNRSSSAQFIEKGQRIAQAIVSPYCYGQDKPLKDKRTGGLGSTGR